MKKKVLCALLMAAMMLSAAGCGGRRESLDTKEDIDTVEYPYEDNTENKDEDEKEHNSDEPMYPNALLTTKLNIKIWNNIKHQMENRLTDDSYTYYTDTDIWNLYKETTLADFPEYAELTDLEFWNIIEKGYISTFTYQANGYANTLHGMFNEYISNSGSNIFNVDSVESFDVVIRDNIWECKQFPAFSKDDLVGPFGGGAGSIKIYYKNSECVAIIFIEGTDDIIETGSYGAAPAFTDSGSFEYYYWMSDDGQVNRYNEIVGIYPPPLH